MGRSTKIQWRDSMNPLEQYMAKLHERHNQLKTAWDNCVIYMTSADAAARQQGLRELLEALTNLEGILTSGTTPQWLKAMQNCAAYLTRDKYFNDSKQRLPLFRQLSDAGATMQSHVFDASVTNDTLPLVNFDEVVSKHHDQETINQIYDKAIDAIREALDSGEIDSMRVREDLRRILATIEEAKQSTFMNQIFQLPNLQIYLRAVAKVSARKVPVLNFVLEVIDEANELLEKAEVNASKEIKASLVRQSQEVERIIKYQPVLIEHRKDDPEAAAMDADSRTPASEQSPP